MSEAAPPVSSPPNSGALQPGDTLADGRYVITRKLGEGGMGVVYLAEQKTVERAVVVKLIHRHLISDPDVVGRFQREMHVTAQIEHPNTVRVYDCGEERGQPYLVTEYVPGEDLATLLTREGRVAIDRLVPIAEQIARGLRAAHAAGIVHRDLKPANVMVQSRLGERDRVTVLDFGIAKPLGEHAHLKTGAGLLIGTPTYMSPEQCAGLDVDARSDLYALGLLMFEMAVGRPPFTHEAITALLVAHISSPPPPIADEAPDAPPALHQLIDSLLAKAPDQRPPSADAVVESLEAIRADLRQPSMRLKQAPLPRTSMLHIQTSPQSEAPSVKHAPVSRPRLRWILLAAAAAGGIAIWQIAGSQSVEPRTLKADFSAWKALSAAEEPPYPDECRSGSSGLPQLLLEVGVRGELPNASWLSSVRQLPDASPEKWLLLARHGLDDAERGDGVRKAVQSCQSSSVAHNLLGNVLQKEGAFVESASHYEQAIALSGTYLAPRFNLAVLDLRQGRVQPGLARLNALHRDRPEYPGLAPLLGKALLAAGRAQDAVAVLRPAIARAPAANGALGDLWYLLGEAYEGLGDRAESDRAYCKAKSEGQAEAAKRCTREVSATGDLDQLPPK